MTDTGSQGDPAIIGGLTFRMRMDPQHLQNSGPSHFLINRSVNADRLSKRDARVMLDNCSFISASDFNKPVKTIATKNNCNIMNCEKKPSQQSKCIQIIDYIVGSIWRLYERSNPTYLDKLVDKVSVARKY